MKNCFSITLCAIVLFFACQSKSQNPKVKDGNKRIVNVSIKLPRPEIKDLRIGDLLFQDIDCGSPCDAIETVTQGFAASNLSHVAIITSINNNEVWVTEAIGEKVEMNTLETFLKRSKKVFVGRLKSEHRHKINDAISYINEVLLNKPYDNFYLMNNGSYYCSEIIYEGFKKTAKGKDLFSLMPMTFKDPKTNAYFDYWRKHYAKIKQSIPEGEPGLNPGGMSRAACLDIIYAYEMPSRKFEVLDFGF